MESLTYSYDVIDLHPSIMVRCPECDESFDEHAVIATGISEDLMGRDVLEFICPSCGKDRKSLRFG